MVDLAKAKANLKAYARNELSKRELVQFRIDKENMMLLLELADQSRKPLGTMVREWVLERAEQERAAHKRGEG